MIIDFEKVKEVIDEVYCSKLIKWAIYQKVEQELKKQINNYAK